MKFGLPQDTINKISEVFGLHPEVSKVILYGSRAKGTYKNSSDIDLTVVGDDISLSILNTISWQLDDLLLPYTIDLSLYHHIGNDDLLDHIQRVGIIFYERG